MNWKYVLIVFILAILVGAGTFWLEQNIELSINYSDIVSVKDDKVVEDEVVFQLDKAQVLEKIEQAKEFLLRMDHSTEHGFYKRYEALTDTFEERLHAVYSASIIYTLLKAYEIP